MGWLVPVGGPRPPAGRSPPLIQTFSVADYSLTPFPAAPAAGQHELAGSPAAGASLDEPLPLPLDVPLEGPPREDAPVPAFFGATVGVSFASLFGQPATAGLYWDFLSRLYVATFESDRLRILKEDALEMARQAWLAQTEREPEAVATLEVGVEEGEERSFAAELAAAHTAYERELAAARYMLRRAQRCGWLHLEYQREYNADAIFFTPAAARTLDTWLREARDERPPLQGYLLHLQGLLAPDLSDDQLSLMLLLGQRTLREFHRELLVLSQDMARSIERVLREAATPHAVLQEAVDRYGRRVTAQYHRAKTVENVHRLRVELLHALDTLAAHPVRLARGAEAWTAREDVGPGEAIGLLRAALDDMRERLLFLPSLLGDLDERNAKFSGAAMRQLLYLLHQDAQIEAKLEGALRTLASESGPPEGIAIEAYPFRGLAFHSEEAEGGAVGEDGQVRIPLAAGDEGAAVTTAFLYRQPAPPVIRQREPVLPPSEAPDLGAAERLAQRLADTLTPERLDGIAEAILGPALTRPMRDVEIQSPGDYLRVLVGVLWARRGEGRVAFRRLSCRGTEGEDVCGDRACPSCRHRSGPYVLPNGVFLRQARQRTGRSRPGPVPSSGGRSA